MHTMVALLTSADSRSAADTAPPELTPGELMGKIH
jgi:hypothetical protein